MFTFLYDKFTQDNTIFCQNWLGFAEDMTKTFWCVIFRFKVYLRVLYGCNNRVHPGIFNSHYSLLLLHC